MAVTDIQSSAQFYAMFNSWQGKSGTIVMYTAKWCGPCQQIKPYFEELAKSYTQMQFLKVDVDQQADLAHSANVRGMPTFTIYKNRHKMTELVGADKKGLYDMINAHYQA